MPKTHRGGIYLLDNLEALGWISLRQSDMERQREVNGEMRDGEMFQGEWKRKEGKER